MKWARLYWDHRFLQMMRALYIPSLWGERSQALDYSVLTHTNFIVTWCSAFNILVICQTSFKPNFTAMCYVKSFLLISSSKEVLHQNLGSKSSNKVEWTDAPYSCLYASSIYVTQGWLEIHHTWPAVFSSIYVIRQLYISRTVHSTKNLAHPFILPY